jgi:hypothetical protein
MTHNTAAPSFAGLTSDALRARNAAVAAVALQRLWDHTRRGRAAALWDVLLREARLSLTAARAAADALTLRSTDPSRTTGAGSSKAATALEAAEAADVATHALLLLAQGVHFHRGSRVEDYGPLLSITSQALKLLPLLQQQQQPSARVAVKGMQQQQKQPPSPHGGQQQPLQTLLQLQLLPHDHDWTASDFQGASLQHAALQLLLGIVLGHVKEVGASRGLPALQEHSTHWALALNSDTLPDEVLLAVAQGLVSPPSSAAAAQLFAPQLLGGLGRLLRRCYQLPDGAGATRGGRQGGRQGGSGDNSSSSSSSEGRLQMVVASRAIALLLQTCELLRPDALPGVGLPLLLTAQPDGTQLAAAAVELATGWHWRLGDSGGGAREAGDSRSALLRAWAGLRLLPHACARPSHALAACRHILVQCDAALAATAPGDATLRDLRRLRGVALTVLADLLPSADPDGLPQAAADAWRWLQTQASAGDGSVLHDADTLEATAALFDGLKSYILERPGSTNPGPAAGHTHAAPTAAAHDMLGVHQLPAAVKLLLPSLTARSQRVRGAALGLLCSFQQPVFVVGGGSSGSGEHHPAAKHLLSGQAAAAGNNEEGGGVGSIGGSSTTSSSSSSSRAAFQGLPCDALLVLREMHVRPCSVEAGRRWAVSLERLGSHLEYGRLPPELVAPMVAGLIGVLHIR